MEDVTTKTLGLEFAADELGIILDGLEALAFVNREQLAGVDALGIHAPTDEAAKLRKEIEFIEATITKISDAIQYAPIPDDLVQTVAIEPEVAALSFDDTVEASSACKRERWCVRQVGHPGECAAVFLADGSVGVP